MTHRFALRFESGDRQGEVVPLGSASFFVGRRPGNSLQILDPSVSGRHAELYLEGASVSLQDLGSTNGTKVDGKPVREHTLAHGERISFGNVVVAFEDTESSEPVPPFPAAEDSPAPPPLPTSGGPSAPPATRSKAPAAAAPPPPADDAEAGRTVSAENLARAAKGSRSTLLVLVAAVALGGGAYWYFAMGGGGGSETRGRRTSPVVAVDGNLLSEGYSFEGEGALDTWTAAEDAPVAFELASAGGSFSGARVASATVGADDWSELASRAVSAPIDKALLARATVEAQGARATLVIEFLPKGEGGRPLRATSRIVEGEATEVELRTPVPDGYDRARVVLRAEGKGGGADGEGTVRCDDVSLVVTGGGGPTVSFEGIELFALGDPAYSAVVRKVSHPILEGLGFYTSSGPVAVTSAAEESGIRISGPSATTLLAFVGPRALESGPIAAITDLGLVGLGSGGPVTGANGILYGGGNDLVLLRFDAPATAVGQKQGGGVAILVEGVSSALVQLRFQDERRSAIDLAAEAQSAERGGRPGEALAAWGRLLREAPFDAARVSEAEAARARLLQGAREELAALEDEVERGRFFRLVDLFRQNVASIAAARARYAGSEVEASFAELEDATRAELAALEVHLDAHERDRVRAILAALEAQGAESLVQEVKTYLATHFAEGE